MILVGTCLKNPCTDLIFFEFQTLKLQENGRIFTNVKQLALTIYPFDDEDKLCWISYILKAFPLLQKLQLNVSTHLSLS